MTEIIIDSYQYFISDEQFLKLKSCLEINKLIIKNKESSNRYYLNIDHCMFEDILFVLRGNKLELKQYNDNYRNNLLRLSELLKVHSLTSQINEYYENKDSDCQYLYNKTLNIIKKKAIPFNEKIYESISNIIELFYSLIEKNNMSEKHIDSIIEMLCVFIPDKSQTDCNIENDTSIEFKSNEVYPYEERISVHLEDLKDETINRISQNDDSENYDKIEQEERVEFKVSDYLEESNSSSINVNSDNHNIKNNIIILD